jgi:hypothetical protein
VDWWVDDQGTAHERGTRIIQRGSLFTQFPWNPGEHPEEGYRRTSLALFCPECGDIWARLLYQHASGDFAAWDIERVACLEHPSREFLAGSVLGRDRDSILPLLSPELIRLELIAHLKGIEHGS